MCYRVRRLSRARVRAACPSPLPPLHGVRAFLHRRALQTSVPMFTFLCAVLPRSGMDALLVTLVQLPVSHPRNHCRIQGQR